ncbi:MAG: alpha/beta hydrolase [Cypionkella sp.]
MTRELKFGRRAPVSGKAASMVVFVHGYGADGADLLGLADVLGPHLPDTVFYAPDAPEPCAGNPFGRQWFGIPRFDGSSEVDAAVEMNRAADDLNGFIDVALQAEDLEPKALILVGFSQGAMMALHVAPRRDVAVAGVIAISGKLMRPATLAMEMKVKPEVLLMHGDRDEVVPFGEMQAAGNALVSNGFQVYAHVMQGSGHGIAQDGLQVALSFISDRLGKA